MPESGLRASLGRPVPAVQVDDLKRVWSFLAEQDRDPHPAGPSSVDIKLLVDLCAPNANVLAVSFRSMLITLLLHQGRLDRWRDENGLLERVFEVSANFPLPQGLENADVDALVAALN